MGHKPWTVLNHRILLINIAPTFDVAMETADCLKPSRLHTGGAEGQDPLKFCIVVDLRNKVALAQPLLKPESVLCLAAPLFLANFLDPRPPPRIYIEVGQWLSSPLWVQLRWA